MKSILLLTDFSPNATSAAEAALLLCRNMHRDLIVFNSYIKHMELPSSIGAGWDVEEFSARHHHSKVGMQALSEGLEALVAAEPEGYRPVINSFISDNDLGMSVKELILKNPVELVVMGAVTEGGNSYVHEMNINVVIDNAAKPVLIIPPKGDLKKLSKIIFATEFRDADLPALHYLAKLGGALHYQIEVVHIHDKDDMYDNSKRQHFKDGLAKIRYTGLSFKNIYAENVTVRLKHLCQSENAMLALVHHHTSLFAKVFEHSIAKQETAHQQFPLLTFPSNLAAYGH